MASRMMAPITDAMNPADDPSWYKPMARPIKVATKDPAIPSSIVMIIPPGSLPGIRSLAIAPITSPMINVQMRCIVILLFMFETDLTEIGDG
jgi:hypothetical protein